MRIFLAMAASIESLVMPVVSTHTTAWLSQCMHIFWPAQSLPQVRMVTIMLSISRWTIVICL